MEIILYSQKNCILCKMLKNVLDKKNISYIVEDNVENFPKEIKTVPKLSVDGTLLSTQDSVKWANEQEG